MSITDTDHEHLNYLAAIGFGLIGWLTRVGWYYFKYSNLVESKKQRFIWKKFWTKYDQYIYMGFIGCVALALISDVIWHFIDQWFVPAGEDPPKFDERVNIIIGFIAITILSFIDRKSNSDQI